MNTIKRSISILSLVIAFVAAGCSQTVLTAIDGSRVDLQAQKDKVVVLAIGAAWLPLSGKQADLSNALANRYKGRNVVVYFIVTDSAKPGTKNFASDDAIKSFASTNKITVPVLRDSDGITVQRYKVDQMPSFVILDKTGALSGRPIGGIDTDQQSDQTARLARVIDRLLM